MLLTRGGRRPAAWVWAWASRAHAAAPPPCSRPQGTATSGGSSAAPPRLDCWPTSHTRSALPISRRAAPRPAPPLLFLLLLFSSLDAQVSVFFTVTKPVNAVISVTWAQLSGGAITTLTPLTQSAGVVRCSIESGFKGEGANNQPSGG